MAIPKNVLFLCTGNSARSVLAECLLRRLGEPDGIASYSAGSHPKDAPHPQTLALLEAKGYDTSDLRSKSWDEFAAEGAPPIDLVITVCDSARDETCPIWPHGPIATHWGIPDPAAAQGSEAEIARAFEAAYAAMERRIERFLALPRRLTGNDLERELHAIGNETDEG
ncbi:MAG: arsenate reductase ArsC [Myxococcota bacterium]